MATETRGPRADTPRRPPFAASAWRIFDLSLGQMLWSRRTIFMVLVVGAPIALAAIFRVLQILGAGRVRVDGAEMAGTTIFGFVIWLLYLRFIVPVLAAFYGTSLIADEVDDKTITYLFSRPIPRSAVLIGKYLAYVACTGLVVLPSVVLVYFLLVPMSSISGASIAASFPSFLKDLGLLAAGLAVYGAVFAFIGAALKRPLVIGLFFAFGWEPAALLFPGYLKRFTVAYYLQALVPHSMPQEGVVSLVQSVFRDSPGPLASLVSLGVVGVVFLALAARAVERREYVLEQ